jgi:hypothetical protein
MYVPVEAKQSRRCKIDTEAFIEVRIESIGVDDTFDVRETSVHMECENIIGAGVLYLLASSFLVLLLQYDNHD